MLIDTNIAIHLREGDQAVLDRLAVLDNLPSMSMVTLVELFGGVANVPHREPMTLKMAERFQILPFERRAADVYLGIVKDLGFVRALILDRMIAATAIAADLALATINVRDFRDIPGLRLEDWSQ